MVAVFTGVGAGFERSSVTQLGPGGLMGSAAQGRSGDLVSLNAATGNLIINRQDEFLVGRGPDVGISRTYNSSGDFTHYDENGDQWRQSTDRRLVDLIGTVNTNGSSIKRISADGSEVEYEYTWIWQLQESRYQAKDGAGADDVIRYDDVTQKWSWTDGDSQITEVYEASEQTGQWRIKSQSNSDGKTISFGYLSATDKLETITTDDGNYLKYTWDGDNISSIESYIDNAGTPTLTRTSYTYDSLDRLWKVTTDLSPEDNDTSDNHIYRTTYTYDGSSKRIASITQTDGSQLDIVYDSQQRVKTLIQTTAAGEQRTTRISYDLTDPAYSGLTYTRITLPGTAQNASEDQHVRLYHDADNQLIHSFAPAPDGGSHLITSYEYDADGNVTKVTDAEGDAVDYTYTANGNIATVSNAIETSYRFHDANNNLVRLRYVSSHASGVNSWSNQHYIYDTDNHLRFEVSAEGEVTEYIYNNDGLLEYVTKYPEHEYDGALNLTLSLSQLEGWKAGLEAAGELSSTQVLQNFYNSLGQITRTVKFSDASDTPGDEFNGSTYSDTRYTYDQSGNLLTRKLLGQDTEVFTYDGLGRMISSTDLNGGTTTIEFLDSQTKTKITSAYGYYQTQTYNLAGELIDMRSYGQYDTLLEESYEYDARGQLRTYRDGTFVDVGGVQTERASYYLYDNTGRKTGEVNHLGQLTEYFYDNVGRVLGSVRYNTAIETADLNALNVPTHALDVNDVRPAADHQGTQDIWQWSAYDAKGRVVATAQGDGALTTYSYDKADNLISTYSYAARIDPSDLSALKGGTQSLEGLTSETFLTALEHADDTQIRTYYDRSGRVIGLLNAENHFTEIVYDEAGREITRIAYASDVTGNVNTHHNIVSNITLDPVADITSRRVYDGQGFLRFTIDPEGHVMEYIYERGAAYNTIGLVRQTVEYETPISLTLAEYDYETVLDVVNGNASTAGLSSVNDQLTFAVYNNLGQQTYSIDAVGSITGYVYDALGNVTQVIQFADTRLTTTIPTNSQMNNWATPRLGEARITYNYYSDSGKLRASINAEGYATRYSYDAQGRVDKEWVYAVQVSPDETWTTDDALGISSTGAFKTEMIYDELGRLSTVSDNLGQTRNLTYHANGSLAREYVGEGAEQGWTEYEYDAAGRQKVMRQYIGTSGGVQDVATTEYEYDTFGRLTQTTHIDDENSAEIVTLYEYDDNGQLVSEGQDLDGNGVIDAGSDPQAVFSYDAFGRAISTQDAQGNVSTTQYDQLGRVSFTQLDIDGSAATTDDIVETHFEYDAFGNLNKITDPEGNVTQFTHDDLGRVLTETRLRPGAADIVTQYSYNAFGQMETMTDPRGYITQYEYDDMGRVTHVKDPVLDSDTDVPEFETVTTYTAFGQVESVTRDGDTSLYFYDIRGQLEKTEDALGHFELYEYNSRGQLTKLTDKEGGVTTYTYDGRGLKLSETVEVEAYTLSVNHNNEVSGNASGDELTSITTKYEYNDFGQMAKMTNASGGETTYLYDSRGLLESETVHMQVHDAAGVTAQSVTTKYTYDLNGNQTSKIEAFGLAEQRTTRYYYDGANRLEKVEYPAFEALSSSTDIAGTLTTPTETYIYDLTGNLIETTAVDGAKTVNFYDALNRITHIVSPTGTLTEHDYDANSNIVETKVFETELSLPITDLQTPPSGSGDARTTTFEYDALGRMEASHVLNVDIAVYTPAEGTAAASFSFTQDIALTTAYEYDAKGNVVRVTDPNGHEVYSYYDAAGRKTTQIDQEGYRTDWTYDKLGNVTREHRYAEIEASSPSLNSVYTPSTASTNLTDTDTSNDVHVDDRITDYTYDEAGRRLSETRLNVEVFDESTETSKLADAQIVYTYNALGQVTTKTEATGDEFTYIYDDQGRLTTELKPQYDAYVNASVTDLGETPAFHYAYTALGELAVTTHQGRYGNGSDWQHTAYTYDAAGQLSSVTDASGFTRHYNYDSSGRVLRENYERLVYTPKDFAGDVDWEDRIQERNETSLYEAIAYQYDVAGRVTEQSRLTGSLNANSELSWSLDTTTDSTYSTYNAFGDVAASGINAHQTQSFEYDSAGRLWRTDSGDGIAKVFAYDGNGNQTLAITSTGTDLSGYTDISGALDLWGVDGVNILTANTAGVIATMTTYDGRNYAANVYEPQRELGNSVLEDITTTRAYNAFGDIAYEADTDSHAIDYSYNTMGRRIKVESPVVAMTTEANVTFDIRPTEQFYYDVSGRLVASRDANGSYTAPSGSETVGVFTEHTGNLTMQALLAGSGYDGAQALITQTTFADNSTTSTEYDVFGNARRMTDQVGRETVQDFDEMGRVIKVTRPGYAADYYTYDGLGQQIRHNQNISGNNLQELTAYDAAGRIIGQTSKGGSYTSYNYTWDATLTATGLSLTGGHIKTTTYATGQSYSEHIEQHMDVFGRTLKNIDMSGREINFTFDVAGRLISKATDTSTNIAGETLFADEARYTYLNTGQIELSEQDFGNLNSTANTQWWTKDTEFTYDARGNVLTEKLTVSGRERFGYTSLYGTQTNYDSYTNRVYKDATATYDALGRLETWEDEGWSIASGSGGGSAEKNFYYDANSNIRRTEGENKQPREQTHESYTTHTFDDWFAYDSLNRLIISEGDVQNGALVRTNQGTEISYFADGQRYIVETGNGTRERYAYNDKGLLSEIYMGATLNSKRSEFTYNAQGLNIGQTDFHASGTYLTPYFTKVSSYTREGQLRAQTTNTYNDDNERMYAQTVNRYGEHENEHLGQVEFTTNHSYEKSSSGVVDQDTVNTTRTNYNYALYNSYTQSGITHYTEYTDNNADNIDDNPNDGETHTTSFTLASNGEAVSVSIHDERRRHVNFVTDHSGQVIRRQEKDYTSDGDPVNIYHRFSGKQMLTTTNNRSTETIDYLESVANRRVVRDDDDTDGHGAFNITQSNNNSYEDDPFTDAAQSYDAINSYSQGSASSSYTVQAGDSLHSIAQSVYGDSSLWYKLAQANGITNASAPLPAGRALTLPAGVVKTSHNANTVTPYDPGAAIGDVSPTAPKPGDDGCGVVGAIIVAVVAVAVTALTAGAGLVAMGAATTMFGTGGAIGMIAGGSVIGAVGLPTAIALGATAAAVGSVASQGAAMAMDMQEDFSWNAVALAAVGGGISAGLSGVMPQGLEGIKGLAVAGARGMLSSAMTQGIGSVAGWQDKFSWNAVAAAGVSSMTSTGVGGSGWSGMIKRSAASALASSATLSAMNGGSFDDNLVASIPNVVGDMLSYAMGGGATGEKARSKAAAQEAAAQAKVKENPVDMTQREVSVPEWEDVGMEDVEVIKLAQLFGGYGGNEAGDGSGHDGGIPLSEQTGVELKRGWRELNPKESDSLSVSGKIIGLGEMRDEAMTRFLEEVRGETGEALVIDMGQGQRVYDEATAFMAAILTDAQLLKFEEALVGTVLSPLDKITFGAISSKIFKLDAKKLSFSQSSISSQKRGLDYNFNDIVESMKKDGWTGKPIDVVMMRDGMLTSVDNTRVLAARQANIPVEARIHSYNEPIPVSRANTMKVKGVMPRTWGEAITMRINKPIQNDYWPGWSETYPHGSLYDPVLLPR